MIINDSNGKPMKVTDDGRGQVVAVMQTDINALATIGKAWTLPFTQAAADATDNVVWHFKNTSDSDFEIMRLICSAAIKGTWTIESGRVYSSGGTAQTLQQLKIGGGITQDMTAYYGADIQVTGTAKDIYYFRTEADSPVDILQYGPIVIQPSQTVAIKFNADSGTPTMAVTPILHGANPWE